jgi:hypothetical protein
MGIHYPFKYVGYEGAFLHTFIDLIDNFCTNCHTNDDVDNDCGKCPIGNLIFAAENYLMNAPDWYKQCKAFKEELKVLKRIKQELFNFDLKPGVNSQIFLAKHREKDKLLKLREYLKDYKHLIDRRNWYFRLDAANDYHKGMENKKRK